jgi:adenylate cyclase
VAYLPAVDATTSLAPITRGISLRTRWTVLVLLLTALPLLALAWVTTRTVRAGLTDAERDLQVTIIDRAAYAIRSELEYAGESTHRAGTILLNSDAGTPEQRQQLARDMLARAAALLHIAVYAPSGERVDTIFRTNGGGREPAPPESISSEFLNAPPENGQWMRAEFFGSSVAIRYIEPIRMDGHIAAWIVGTLNPRWLDVLVQNISLDRYKTRGRIVVVDDGMRLLVSSVAPIGSSLASRDIFIHPESLSGQERREISLTTEYNDRGEHMVGTLQVMSPMRWIIAVRRPQQEAYSTLATAQHNQSIAALVCLVIAGIVGALLARKTTQPIASLVQLTQSYAARKFSEKSSVKTADELEVLGGALEGMATRLQESETEIQRQTKVQNNLSRFLPAEAALAIAKGEQALTLGGVRRNVAVLFADVASFTHFAESAPPEKVVAFLNELFTVLTEVVFRHGGMVDKFLGDCMMAVFGTGSDPRDTNTSGPDAPCARALAAAEDIHRFVEASAPAWKDSYGIDVQLGVGVNLGEALVGNLGSESRMEYTVIGDVVNVAARLESLARGGQTLATGVVVRAVGQSFGYKPLGQHPLRGKKDMVEIFEVTS